MAEAVVAVVMGSKSDAPTMQEGKTDLRVRNPQLTESNTGVELVCRVWFGTDD